ncbi:MAG: Hsp70 family protein [Polyangiaceae bacterium]
MQLGIDLGTTRTVVAAFDRGNYPVVEFTVGNGDLIDHYPTVTADVGGKLIHGIDADLAAREGAPNIRSWKRLLAQTRKDEPLVIGSVETTPVALVTGFLGSLRDDLRSRSSIGSMLVGDIEAVVSVPANAHSTQRFTTLDGFKRAGYDVRAVLNEPAAAGIEFAHRHSSALNSRREHVVVYDLGGGTFDAALVYVGEGRHDIETTSGISELGGDDFDAQLLAMALEKAGRDFPENPAARADLLRECRHAKESIHPNTRKIALDLLALGDLAPEESVILPVAEFYERTKPLVTRTLEAIEPLVAMLQEEHEGGIAGIYMVGGASGLPIVPRTVREKFGRRLHRSPHPAAATAIGCAIAAVNEKRGELSVAEKFTRHFGVFREAERGGRAIFDGIFAKGTPMPQNGSIVKTRRYRAAHDIAHFRFVEAGDVDPWGNPTGDLTPHAEILFAVAHQLEGLPLTGRPVSLLGREGPLIEERYEVDYAGVISFTISDLDTSRVSKFVL